jgi:hypothetical protein
MSDKIARVVTAISFAVVLFIVLVIVPSAERRERERTVATESSTPVYKIYPYALGDSSTPGIYPIGSKLCLRAAVAADGYWWTAPSSADRESFSWYCDDPRVWNRRVVVSVFLSFMDTECNTKGCPVRKVEFNFYPDEDDRVDIMSSGSGFVPNHYRRDAVSEDQGRLPQQVTPHAESFAQPTPRVSERLTPAKLGNMTYLMAEAGRRNAVRLVDGKGHGESEFGVVDYWLDTEHVVLGDIYGGGIADAVVVLGYSGGGSGAFYKLVAVTQRSGKIETSVVKSLGDRIKINKISIRSRVVSVDMTTQGPNDPMCCPTERQVLRFAEQGGRFVPLQ